MESHHRWCNINSAYPVREVCTCRPRLLLAQSDEDRERLLRSLVSQALGFSAATQERAYIHRTAAVAKLTETARKLVAADQKFVDDLLATIASPAYPPNSSNTKWNVQKVLYALRGIDWETEQREHQRMPVGSTLY